MTNSKFINSYFQLLKKCSNPTGNKDGIRLEASAEVRTELYKGN